MGKIPEDGRSRSIEELLNDPQAITAALSREWRHKQLGESIVIWRDGKVVHVPPEEIDVEKPE
ncbi:MAG TPA: hypothetical protein VHL58_07120 [Thermoanaerobaculia bacterium]|nr:hypothetical protein [Thermoanaerobaculia bacterium]